MANPTPTARERAKLAANSIGCNVFSTYWEKGVLKSRDAIDPTTLNAIEEYLADAFAQAERAAAREAVITFANRLIDKSIADDFATMDEVTAFLREREEQGR